MRANHILICFPTADLEVAKKQLAEESNIENHVKRHTKSGEPISKMGDSQVDENEAKETSPKVQKTSSKSKQPTTPPPKAKHHTKEKLVSKTLFRRSIERN